MGSVDYHRVAHAYEHGRAPVAHTADWGELVAPHLPEATPLRVLDLGAGTGIFSRAWPQWGASLVVGVDPSAAMLDEAKAAGLGSEVHLIVGAAEALPLADDAVDVAWLSAVVHHFVDRPRCARELRRVVAPGGRLLVRELFAGLSRVGWLDFFEGADRAIKRFPTLEEIETLFAPEGFTLVAVEQENHPPTPVAAAREWVAKMRHVDTLLTALTDEEFEGGLAALDATEQESLTTALHLAVFA